MRSSTREFLGTYTVCVRSVVNDQSAWKNSGVGDFPVTRAHPGKVYASRVRAAHSQIVSKKYNDGKKKMPTSASESNKDGKSGLGSGGSRFFCVDTLGLIRAPRGEADV